MRNRRYILVRNEGNWPDPIIWFDDVRLLVDYAAEHAETGWLILAGVDR